MDAMAGYQKVEKKKVVTPQSKQPAKTVQKAQATLTGAAVRGGSLTPAQVVQLQRAGGNAATARLLEQAGNESTVQREGEEGASFGLTVGGITPLQQPSSKSCWATVTTMMASYADSQPYTLADIPDVVARAGETYRQIYTANTGLSNSQKAPFLEGMGLVSEPPATYIARAVYDMLSSYGPLWVTTDGGSLDSVHARIVIGMGGDGSPAGTAMQLIDPADGAIHDESYEVFVRRYTNVAVGDMEANLPFRAQIVHW